MYDLIFFAAITVALCYGFFHLGVWGTKRYMEKHIQETPYAVIFDKAVSYLEEGGYIRIEEIDGVEHIIPIERLLERERANHGSLKAGEKAQD